MPASPAKRRTNVTIRSDLLEAAQAFPAREAWTEEHGLPLAQWQVWKPE